MRKLKQGRVKKKLNKLEEKNKDIKTQEEIMLEEEKIDKECTGLDQKTKDDLQKDGFKIVEAKVILIFIISLGSIKS